MIFFLLNQQIKTRTQEIYKFSIKFTKNSHFEEFNYREKHNNHELNKIITTSLIITILHI